MPGYIQKFTFLNPLKKKIDLVIQLYGHHRNKNNESFTPFSIATWKVHEGMNARLNARNFNWLSYAKIGARGNDLQTMFLFWPTPETDPRITDLWFPGPQVRYRNECQSIGSYRQHQQCEQCTAISEQGRFWQSMRVTLTSSPQNWPTKPCSSRLSSYKSHGNQFCMDDEQNANKNANVHATDAANWIAKDKLCQLPARKASQSPQKGAQMGSTTHFNI